MDMEKCQWEFFWINPPQYTGVRRGRPARDLMIGMLETYQGLGIKDDSLRASLVVSTFNQDAKV